MSNQHLKPFKAIRLTCKECNGNTGWAAVRDCSIFDCQLHEYRSGRRPKEKAKLTPGKAIDEYCLFCMGARVVNGKTIGRKAAANRARECHLKKCLLWHIRYGEKKTLTGRNRPLKAVCGAEASETMDGAPEQPERRKQALRGGF